jgi:hypothetical protein
VIALADSGTLVAGIADRRADSHRVVPGTAQVTRTDFAGSVVWSRGFGGGKDSIFHSIIRAGETEFVLVGEIEASASWQEGDIYLVKIDSDGEVVWEHVFEREGGNHVKGLHQTADGGFIIAGSPVDRYMTGDGYQSDLLLIRTDSEGNEIWSRTYGQGVLYLAQAVEQATDGGFVVAGWEAPNNWDDRNVLVAKVDSAGHVEWWKTWDPGDPGGRDGAFDMILAADGHIVVACIEGMGSGAPSASLLKLTLEGTEVWWKLIGDKGIGNTFWSIMELDGEYIMVGDTHVGQSGHVTHHAGLIANTDADGNLLWQRTFGHGEYDQVTLAASADLQDGSLAVVGSVVALDARSYDSLWLKVERLPR